MRKKKIVTEEEEERRLRKLTLNEVRSLRVWLKMIRQYAQTVDKDNIEWNLGWIVFISEKCEEYLPDDVA
jgi:hypothetical protein